MDTMRETIGVPESNWVLPTTFLAQRRLPGRPRKHYRYLESRISNSLIFQAWGKTREAMFVAASDALMNAMLKDLNSVCDQARYSIHLEAEVLDTLLFDLLKKLIYFRNADQQLTQVVEIKIEKENSHFKLETQLCGEKIDPARHPLYLDIRAINPYQFKVQKTQGRWWATVLLDLGVLG